MQIKEFLNLKGISKPEFGTMAKSAKSSFADLMKPETFKQTMKSLVDFSPPNGTVAKPKRSNVYDLAESSQMAYANLINAESELGRTLFGPIPYGHQREFFEHKKNVWVWHDSWLDEKGGTQGITIRYEVRPAGVYKKYDGGTYTKIEGQELDNFRQAARMYLDLIKTHLYNNDVNTLNSN